MLAENRGMRALVAGLGFGFERGPGRCRGGGVAAGALSAALGGRGAAGAMLAVGRAAFLDCGRGPGREERGERAAARRRCMRCTSGSARGWWPSPATTMPVQYPAGVLKEHLHTRTAAGLFDVSHMGQVALRPRSGDLADAARGAGAAGAGGRRRAGAGAAALRALHRRRTGGILDDLMVANRGDHLLLVVNAACKAADSAHLRGGARRAAARSSRWSGGCSRCRGRGRRRCWPG